MNSIVLLMIHYFGDSVKTKTKVMKLAYFLGELLKRRDLGFYAHFYGPYSDKVSNALSQLVYLGFINEKCLEFGYDQQGFERYRYDYSINKEGKKVVRLAEGQCPKEAERIKEAGAKLKDAAGDMDYMALSYAAKTYFLLKAAEKTMTSDEIRRKAEAFSWRLVKHDVDRSVQFLKGLSLVKTS
ncbi:hypothetical protein CH330_08880 [candidate division WOR-3 bacterium JGI_Cruoil_03_51_56]|uniref:Antitoxin SocA-like Panacea domain-containing protein n=1 Tax=candidate division WOR-3 bacterium JGI_Cruoil_03_51_56 TaxID=1973747 RepID=A0A235BPB2_UNCW3|nr:MAG: hypothetical protein CH330_08880 [candidate division WOR-3 bacterium JGI_Cruoil_03_51_56]